MIRLTKIRSKSDIEKLKEKLPDFDSIQLISESDTIGNLFFIETDHAKLITELKKMGFIEKGHSHLIGRIRNLFNL